MGSRCYNDNNDNDDDNNDDDNNDDDNSPSVDPRASSTRCPPRFSSSQRFRHTPSKIHSRRGRCICPLPSGRISVGAWRRGLRCGYYYEDEQRWSQLQVEGRRSTVAPRSNRVRLFPHLFVDRVAVGQLRGELVLSVELGDRVTIYGWSWWWCWWWCWWWSSSCCVKYLEK